MCIHNDVHERKTGESMLTEADLHALSTGWRPKDNYEVQEYNKYYNTWDIVTYLKIDMQTIYLNAIIDMQSADKVLLYFVYRKSKEEKNIFEARTTNETKDEALSVILRNTGLDYNLLLHTLTFQNLPKAIQKDILTLDPEAETSSSYFDDEEKLYDILKDKKTLTHEDVEQLTDLVIDSIPWEYTKFVSDKGLNFSSILFQGYFADIPLFVFAEKLAKKLRISYENEEKLKDKLSKLPNLKQELRDVVYDEVSAGIFSTDYVPLCNSGGYATCNDADTKLPHREVMDVWMKEKAKTRVYLDKYIANGKLVLEERHKELFTIRRHYTVITGESLYYLDEELPFTTDYKKQVEKMMVFGHLVVFIKRREFMQNYAEISYFSTFLQKVSRLLEVDLGFMSDVYITNMQAEIDFMNHNLERISEAMEGEIYSSLNIKHPMEIFMDDIKIRTSGVVGVRNEAIERAEKEIGEYFKTKWESL
jgi:hypothetical protein